MSESGDNDVSIGEMFRLFGRTEKAMDEGFKGVNERFDKFETRFVTKELYESERDGLIQRYQSERDSLTQRVVDVEASADKKDASSKVAIGLWIAVADAVGTIVYAATHLH